MSYDTEILADSPLAYWRLDELLGAVAADFSGNNRDATIFTTPAETVIPVVYGIPAPIETDSVNYGMSGGVGRGPADAVLNTTGAFSWEVWGFNGPDSPDSAILLSRTASAAGAGGTSVRINGQTITARIRMDSTGGTNWEVSHGNQLDWSTWFHIVVTRNSNVLRLYVNGPLVDERIDLPVDTVTLLGQWGLSATSHGVNNTSSWGIARPAIYGTALSAARVLAHYEAAINATFIRGFSNVIPSAVLYSAEEPDPIEFPFRHNWSDNLIERISFRTNVSKARSGPQENGQVRPKPRREIEIAQVMRDNNERRKLRAQLWANQNRKWFIPILEDREQLTAPLAAGATVIPVSTLYKDYEVGSHIGLRQLNDAGVIVKSEMLEVESFDSVSVTPVTQPVNDYDAYVSSVYPVRRGLITPSSLRGHTDAVEDVVITARLLAEDEATVPNRITPWSPTLKYRDVEVFDPTVWQSNDWSERREYESQRQLDEIDFDAGVFGVESDTAGAEETFSYRIVLKGRDDIAAFLGWFYDRAGALNYVWVASMQSDFEIVSVLGSTVTVVGTNYSDNYALAEARRDLAFVYHDNTMELRRVVSFAGLVNETLTLGAAVPTLTNLRSLSLLKFCQLDADSLEIAKETDDVWKFAWRFRELLTTPEGTGLSSMSPSVSVSPSRSPSTSQSPSTSVSPSISPSGSVSPSGSQSPSGSISPSRSPSTSVSPSGSVSHSSSISPSVSPSGSTSPSSSASPSV